MLGVRAADDMNDCFEYHLSQNVFSIWSGTVPLSQRITFICMQICEDIWH